MDYSLAKRLKDAGYPQKGIFGYAVILEAGGHNFHPHRFSYEHENAKDYAFVKGDVLSDECVAPTLEDLIEACGSDFLALSNYAKKGWGAAALKHWRSEPHNVPHSKEVLERGSTPTEAVAMLWLALNSEHI